MIVPIKNTININCQSSIGTGGLSHQGGGFGLKQAGFGGLLLLANPSKHISSNKKIFLISLHSKAYQAYQEHL